VRLDRHKRDAGGYQTGAGTRDFCDARTVVLLSSSGRSVDLAVLAAAPMDDQGHKMITQIKQPAATVS